MESILSSIGQDIEFNSDPEDSIGATTHIHTGQVIAYKKYKKQISIKLNSNEHIHNYFIDEIEILSIKNPSPPPPPPPPPPLVSGATVDDMKDVDKNDPVWVSMLGTAMNTILNIEPREYKATFKNKVARQALVGPLRCVEFNKFAAIKEKEKLNEVIKILVPAGYCKLSKQEPPKSELLSQKNALNDIENLQNDKKAQQNENDEKAKENK
eukprot:202216_1